MKRPIEYDANTLRKEGPSPILDIGRDLARRGALIAPVAIALGAVFWQTAGAMSVAYGLVIVAVNFILAAVMLDKAAQISYAAMGSAAVFGFFTRLSLVTVAVLLVRNASWVELVPLGLTIIIAHLGLLFWEMRYISVSLAKPGLKTSQTLPIHEPAEASAAETTETTGAA